MYSIGRAYRLSLSFNLYSHLQIITPVPLFLSISLSNTSKAEAISDFGFYNFVISIGYKVPFSSIIKSISFSLIISWPLTFFFDLSFPR